MTKEQKVNRDKAICAIHSVVAEVNKITVLEEKVKRIVAEYFPCHSMVLLNAFLDFAVALQGVYLYHNTLCIEVNKHYRY